MHVAAVLAIQQHLKPAATTLRDALAGKARDFMGIVKVGRTHLQDATPLTLGQEFPGYVSQLDHGIEHLDGTLPHLYELALCGTAAGTGLNARLRVAAQIRKLTGGPFVTAPNNLEALAACDGLVHAPGALKTLAAPA